MWWVEEVTWFHYAVHFLEYLANEKCLRDKVFCLLIISSFTFLQRKICWNKDNTLNTQIRIWHVRVLTRQKFINITLVVLKIFKMFKSTWFSRTFDTKQAWCKQVQRKKWSCLSNKFLRFIMTFLNFAGNPFYICLRTYYSIDPLYYDYFLKKLIYAMNNLFNQSKEAIEKEHHVYKSCM